MKNITKIKNFEGYIYHCCKCGKELKHAYRIEKTEGIYGSECVLVLAGLKAKKQIKILNDREKQLQHILSNKSVYFFDEYCKSQNLNETEMVNYYLRTGKLG